VFGSFWLTTVAGLLFTIVWAQKTTPDKTLALEEDPCSTLQSQQQINMCSGKQYQNADARLNLLYLEIEKDLKRDPGKIALDKLKAAERAWLRYRDLHCDAAKHQFEGGSMSPMMWNDCMRMVTEHRIQELKDAYPVDGQPRK
jgi:uncharacterized protein YecT (DUF1311 family)